MVVVVCKLDIYSCDRGYGLFTMTTPVQVNEKWRLLV